MRSVDDLFDRRAVVGTKLERILEERDYTKAKLCREAGISRPTLDKVLAGTITSKTNYEKHLTKILKCMSLTPDMLLGTIQHAFIRSKEIRKVTRISEEGVSKATGIPLRRLKEIEAGETASIVELRDIALCLSTSVRGLLGEGIFGVQLAKWEDILTPLPEEQGFGLHGFWGHIGILPVGEDRHTWYPITGGTRERIYQSLGEPYLVVPCMNNRVLLLNMDNIKEIVLLDEACDKPDFTNWDSGVDCGEIPLVFYEALEDYFLYQGNAYIDDVLSPSFQRWLACVLREKGWSEQEAYQWIHQSVIHFVEGKTSNLSIQFGERESLSTIVSCLYDLEEPLEREVYFEEGNGAELIINMKQVTFLDLPLLEVEEAIIKAIDDQ